MNAECLNCNYHKDELCFGGGQWYARRRDYYCKYPVLNPEKTDILMKDIVKRNEYEKEGYIFYDSDELFDKSFSKDKCNISDGTHDKEYKLYSVKYYCPKCKKYELVFQWCGCWD